MAKFKLLTDVKAGSVGNPKLAKGETEGFLSFVLHLAPAKLSGFNVCPMATAGCIAGCLNTAGRGGLAMRKPVVVDGESFPNTIQAARVRRTRRFFLDRDAFMRDLVDDVLKAIDMAHKVGMTPVFRLNGISDIRWERIPVTSPGGKVYPSIMDMLPAYQFYDYTKIANRRGVPSNYHLTFSLAETNSAQAAAAMASGMNVAVVFGLPKGAPMPETFTLVSSDGVKVTSGVFNGDDTDLRFLDPRHKFIGLYAKGKAKRDTSGFVQRV